MFQGILIDKDESGYRATLQQIDEDQLPEGDVTVRVAYSTLNFKDGLAITGSSPVVRNSRWCRGSTWRGLSRSARIRTTRRVTKSCSMAGAWAKGIGVAWRKGTSQGRMADCVARGLH